MLRWARLFMLVLLAVVGLAAGACGRSRERAYGAGGSTAAAPDTFRRHHSIMAGAAAGAVAGHMMGHHAVTGAIVGAVVQHERNKHQR